jgi:hypothetical protein
LQLICLFYRISAVGSRKPEFTLSYMQDYTSSIFQDVTPWSLLEVNRFFRSRACYLLPAGFLLGLLFNLQDGVDIFIQNVGWHSLNYMALYSKTIRTRDNRCSGNLTSYILDNYLQLSIWKAFGMNPGPLY